MTPHEALAAIAELVGERHEEDPGVLLDCIAVILARLAATQAEARVDFALREPY